MISFKLLSKADAQSIADLYANEFKDGWNLSMLNSAFDTQRFLVVGGYIDGEFVGVITASMGYDDADIESVFVLEKYRRQGVADAMFNEIEKQLKLRGAKRLLLEVRESNLGAKAFYIKKGFSFLSMRKKYYNDDENAVVMVKELSE